MALQANDKVIQVRNGAFDQLGERISNYAELTNVGEGKVYTAELYSDNASGELFVLFPDGIPYYHFTTLLSSLNMPWVNNPDAKAAGWAVPPEYTVPFMHITTKDEADFLVAVDAEANLILVDNGTASPLPETDNKPVEYHEPVFDKANLEKLASYNLLLEEEVELPEQEEPTEQYNGDVAMEEVKPVEVKKMSMVTIVIVIVTVSAAIIALLSTAK